MKSIMVKLQISYDFEVRDAESVDDAVKKAYDAYDAMCHTNVGTMPNVNWIDAYHVATKIEYEE